MPFHGTGALAASNAVPTGAPPMRAPGVVASAVLAMVVLALLQAVVAILFVSHTGDVIATLHRVAPALTPAELARRARGTVIGSVAVHAVVAVAYVWLAHAIHRGRSWARIAVTVLCLAGIAGGLAFLRASSGLIPSEHAHVAIEQGVSLVLRLAVVALLWLPAGARRFFRRAGAAVAIAALVFLVAPRQASAQRASATDARTVRAADTAAAPARSDADEPVSRLGQYEHSVLRGVVVGAAEAGVTQLTNDPEEWGRSWRGYGHRAAAIAGGAVVHATVLHGLAALLDRPAAYAPCGCAPRSRRIARALAGAVIDTRPDGAREVAIPRITAAYLGAYVQSTWFPDHHHRARDVLVNGTISLAIGALLNLVQERRAWEERRR